MSGILDRTADTILWAGSVRPFSFEDRVRAAVFELAVRLAGSNERVLWPAA